MPILLSGRMLHKDYNRKGCCPPPQISGRKPQEAWRQDELIDGKPSVIE
jgi:hypothetical protein